MNSAASEPPVHVSIGEQVTVQLGLARNSILGSQGATGSLYVSISSEPERKACTAASFETNTRSVPATCEPTAPSNWTTRGLFHRSDVSRQTAVPGRRRLVAARITTRHCARFSTASGIVVKVPADWAWLQTVEEPPPPLPLLCLRKVLVLKVARFSQLLANVRGR